MPGPALLGRRADRSGAGGALQDGMHVAGAVVEYDQADRSAHEDDRRPGGKARKHVGGSARAKSGLRALTTECAGKVSRAALLNKDNTDQEETHDQVKDDEHIEENLHC